LHWPSIIQSGPSAGLLASRPAVQTTLQHGLWPNSFGTIQQFAVENRPGAASNIATESLARSQPDGYTVMELATVNAINASLYQNLTYDFVRDILLVAGIAQGPAVMVVNPKVPVTSFQSSLLTRKPIPAKSTWARPAWDTSVIGELFKMMTGINLVHIPCHGAAPELTDLIAGQIQISFDPIQGAIGYIKGGMLRPLAVTTATRTDALPDVPTVSEFVRGFEARTWQGLGVPRGTSKEITALLNNEINSILDDPRLKIRLADLGLTPRRLHFQG
jgi:tripartite-type tricarboxylate transporter receptor subunit TctC